MAKQRSKRKANLNQALSCLTRVLELSQKEDIALTEDEWFTFYACATYVGKINGFHVSHKFKAVAQEAANGD